MSTTHRPIIPSSEAASHTPGPWNIYQPAGNSRLRVYSDHYDIADTSHAGSEDAERANAVLIAAAPDMLATLRRTLGRLLSAAEARGYNPPADSEVVADLEAAIARATGSSL